MSLSLTAWKGVRNRLWRSLPGICIQAWNIFQVHRFPRGRRLSASCGDNKGPHSPSNPFQPYNTNGMEEVLLGTAVDFAGRCLESVLEGLENLAGVQPSERSFSSLFKYISISKICRTTVRENSRSASWLEVERRIAGIPKRFIPFCIQDCEAWNI